MRRPYKQPKPLLCDADAVIDIALIDKYIALHEERFPRYEYLENLYRGFHDIFHLPEKPEWKPDNRLAVNFPRYITDTFMGYCYGVPIKRTHSNDVIDEAIKEFDRTNNVADHEFELVKKACVYGHAYEYVYQDEETQTRLVACNPKEAFIVYDDTVKGRALFAVRYGYKDDGIVRFGEVLTREQIYEFTGSTLSEGKVNPYGMIPVVEYAMNQDRIGIFEEVTTLVETYNKTIGEKANDVDAFAEAYLAVLGAELDEEEVYRIRDDRVINLYGTDNAKDLIVQFLAKPTADASQENLLDRLETLIYQISMVANISDESYGNSSGTALAYKLQAMSNLALTMDRKMIKSLSKRYKLFCSLSTNVSDKDAWKDIEYTPTRNIPKNILEEAQTAQMLEGVVSKGTQLSVLSIVDNTGEEMKKLEEENKPQETRVDALMFGANNNGQSRILEETRITESQE